MSTKRKADSAVTDGGRSAEGVPRRAPRQDPVSCQTCRTRKLKCDRQHPCSNCKTRRVPCIFGTGVANVTNPVKPTHDEKTKTPEVVEGRLLPAENSPKRRVCEGQRSRESSEPQMTADWLEKIVMGQRIPDALPATLKDKLMPDGSNAGQQMIARLDRDTQLVSRAQNPSGHSSASTTTKLTSFLPRESETLLLFKYYLDYVDYIYHVVIPSRVQAQINNIYHCVHNHLPVDLNHLALLFSILAAASYFRHQGSGSSPESSDYAEVRCREFTSLVGAALIQSNYMAYPTIEGLQATIIISHCVPNTNPDSSISSFFVHGTMVSQAKHLGLHCTDSLRYEEHRRANGFDPVDVEMRRRLWWHLVGYDWLLGFLSGPQERTYLINPRHMNVKLPANIEDEDIGKFQDGYSLPDSVPTKMSFANQRVKLATACREIVDKTAVEHFQGLEVNYDTILELDRRLNQVYKEIPDFFRLDPGSRRRYAQLYRDRPTIAWQRLLVQQAFHSRMCRLHREYFIRGARDPKYSYSHVVCLQSARRVLEIKRIMDKDEVRFTPNSSVVWSVMHHVFMAAVILLMDICFNWDDILADKQREEVLEACRMLDKAQQSSSLVREGINAMKEVLQKYWRSGRSTAASNSHQTGTLHANSPADNNGGVAPAEGFASSTTLSTRETAGMKVTAVEARTAVTSSPSNETFPVDGSDRGLEGIWSEFLDSGATFGTDPHDWMGLLTELTDVSAPLSD
ncbi:hypothetical protein VTN77DRAFT_5724 [Rasamsonia byssochlamydoides]|uniref:uncharacterized protein n=1 Tax=Rasamsonia byssochlamydoides TaxID=89139 RepID=UPI003742E758